MNRQIRYEPTRTYRRHRCRVELSPACGAARWCGMIMLLITLAAALAFVHLRSERQKMGRQLQEMRADFALRAKEIANVSMEVESFKSGKYVFRVVKRLGLRRPLPGQVRRIADSKDGGGPDLLSMSMVATK